MTDSFVIIVPARAGSTRLPNKPLALINERTVISRIIDLANSSDAASVYIATDSTDIADHCRSRGANVVITSSDHVSGMAELQRRTKCIGIMGEYSKAEVVNLKIRLSVEDAHEEIIRYCLFNTFTKFILT